jgi:hypothetical protein
MTVMGGDLPLISGDGTYQGGKNRWPKAPWPIAKRRGTATMTNEELPVAKNIQLRPPALVPDDPRFLHHVVEACPANLDANASLDDLVAEVRSLIGPPSTRPGQGWPSRPRRSEGWRR